MDLRNKTGLLIADVQEVRASLRVQLAHCGLDACTVVRNVKEAIGKLAACRYDLIVCDHNLGQGADGQQFLELVRRKKILPLDTAFLMISSEASYHQVSTVAEYSPDDYLCKPFTADALETRLLRILEKKDALKPIYRHMGPKGNPEEALAACDALLARQSAYTVDVLRLKGELLRAAGRNEDAIALYDDVLAQRPVPWAQMGKALALQAAGDEEAARVLLEKTLEASPHYLAAYDSLADILQKTDKVAAQRVVEEGLKVAPSTQRQRNLGALAMDNKDYSRAEQAYKSAVERDKTGFFKSHDDYAGLAKSRIEQGRPKDALAALKEMGQHFARTPELEARQAALESQVHLRAGDKKAAEVALATALAMQKQGNLDAATSLEIAQSCFVAGQGDEARQIIQSVAENYYEDPQVIERARGVFDLAGFGKEGNEFLDMTCKRMIRLNNDAVALAREGRLEEAIGMLVEAADRLRNNAQIAINTAQALLMRIREEGMNPEWLGDARRYLEQAIAANPEHPKLPAAIAFYRKLAPPDAPPLNGNDAGSDVSSAS